MSKEAVESGMSEENTDQSAAPKPTPPSQPIIRLRRLVSHAGRPRSPSFYGIGAEKCGTTWLWQMCSDHPEIGVPHPKELRYFAQLYLQTGLQNFTTLERLMKGHLNAPANARVLEELSTELRIAFGRDPAYKRIFGAMSEKVAGDISPQYCMLPDEGIDHMQRVAPEAKIIFLMRDPVARLISGAKMKAAEADPKLVEEEIKQRMGNRFQIGMCRYSQILPKFEKAFAGKVYTGFLDDVKTSPLEMLKDICTFLDVAYDEDYFPSLNRVANEGKPFEVSRELTLKTYKKLAGEYDALEKIYPERVRTWREKYEKL